MTAQKLDFLMNHYPEGDPVKVRIYVNGCGVHVARFDNDLFPDWIAIDYLPEVIRVMQDVLQAALNTAAAETT